ALISATARSRPSLAWLPNSSSPPEKGCTAPILIASAASTAGAGSAPASRAPAEDCRNCRRLSAIAAFSSHARRGAGRRQAAAEGAVKSRKRSRSRGLGRHAEARMDGGTNGRQSLLHLHTALKRSRGGGFGFGQACLHRAPARPRGQSLGLGKADLP